MSPSSTSPILFTYRFKAPCLGFPVSPPRTTPSELLPLEPAVFDAIHRVNSRFERILHDFRGLQTFPYFPHHKLTAWQNLLGLIQAETNFALSAAIRERAETNALYFDRLCAHRERELADPDDVLLEAEYRKQELAAQAKLNEEKLAQNGALLE